MGEVPDLWRPELLHPLVVHFPVALLIFGSLAFVAAVLVGGRPRWAWLRPAARLALLVGTVGAWAAVWTGSVADSVVARTLCDPPVAEEHETLAWVAAALFTLLVIIEVAVSRLSWPVGRKRLADSVVVVALLVGVGLVGYVGHLGAQLVFQQAAAVYDPGDTCIGFGD